MKGRECAASLPAPWGHSTPVWMTRENPRARTTPRKLKGEIMGTVYKETFTKPLPAGAKIIVRKGQRLAEWKDAKGKTRTAPLTAAGDRITVEAGTYTAKYRDGSGIVRKVATGCRDESAARSVLGRPGTAGRTGERRRFSTAAEDRDDRPPGNAAGRPPGRLP